MKQDQKDFMIDVINVAVFNGILDENFLIKKGSHNRYAGLVTLMQEDDPDKTLYKINPQNIGDAIKKICLESVDGIEDETEKNVLLANKRLDAGVLEPDDFVAIFFLACFGELT